MLSKLRRWLREGLILLALLAGAMLLMDAWRAPQLPASFDSTPLQTLDGENVTLAALSKDEPVLLYFWASWCDMSREELPVVQAMYDQYGGDCGFIVASVEAEDTVSTVEALKQTLDLTTLPMGTGGLDAFLAYEQPGIPFSVLIDADGTVRAMHLGVATAEGRLDALDDIR